MRGWSEGIEIPRLRFHEHFGPSREDYIDLMVNSSYTYSVFGIAFSSFAIAGLVYWMPAFLTGVKGLTAAQADGPLGVSLLAATVLGLGAGGWLADAFAVRKPSMLFFLPGLAMLGAIGCVLMSIYARDLVSLFGGIFLAVGLIFLEFGPCYAIISGVTMPNMRGVACAATLAATHLLGDLWSPTLMGWVIDTFGQRDSMSTGFGQLLAALGAVPVAHERPRPGEFHRRHARNPPRVVDLRHRPPGGITPPATRNGADARETPGGSDPPSHPANLVIDLAVLDDLRPAARGG